MNCDQVFDILTRGPFPTGTACDSGVEAHLAKCDECHRLAEALRPALELFQEAVDPEESRDLPGYWCALATDRKPPVLSYTRETEPWRVPARPSVAAGRGGISAITAWRMAAMLALGVTLGSLAASRIAPDNGAKVPPHKDASIGAPAGDDTPSPTSARSEWAVLPAACLGHLPGNGPRYTVRQDRLLATADLSQVNCCSECHNAASDKVPSAATARVAQHCQVCHTGK